MYGKHTPGPWRRQDSRLVGANGRAVVLAGSWMAFGADDGAGEQRANTRLTEAAPDLLAALEAFVSACDSGPPVELLKLIVSASEQARAAIAKAKGQP